MTTCAPAAGCDFWAFWTAGPQPWPLVHLAIPFTTYYIFSNVWITLFFIWVNESAEWLGWGFAKSYPAIIFGNALPDPEPIGDSMIGDPLVGIAGVALAIYAKYVFDVPSMLPEWECPNWRALRRGVWWRNMGAFALIMFIAAKSEVDFRTNDRTAGAQCRLWPPPVGVAMLSIGLVGVIGSLWALDMASPRMRAAIWPGRPERDTTRAYVVWGATMLFISLFTWCELAEPYILVGIAAGVLAVVYTLALLWRRPWGDRVAFREHAP